MQLDMLKCFQPHAIIVIVAALRLKVVTGFQGGFGLFFFLQKSNVNATSIPE